ncbi:hypothetical protein [Cupriavidus sp. UME77]|uniref:hypothetical protein n=1 Tax=Cupriavidus sp. UME77 TaxID=1862321 RepID=UPI0015FFFD43|nr:hypothetical protein [Cupriavidus sp. UME77]
METIEFSIQGSAQDPYRVTFQRVGPNITANCTCPAGDNGKSCKHRISILDGLTEGIVSGNSAQVATVASWLPGSNIAAALAAVTEAEAAAERAKAEVARAKKRLGTALLGHPS